MTSTGKVIPKALFKFKRAEAHDKNSFKVKTLLVHHFLPIRP